MSYGEMANSGRSGKPETERGMRKGTEDRGEQPLSVSSGGPMPFDNSNQPTLTPAQGIKSIRDFETFLRQSGFNRADAKRIAARGYSAAGDDHSALVELLRANLERLQDV